MKKILTLIAGILLLAGTACQAATLQWDHDGADGFIVYYTDGTNSFNYTVGDVRTCDTALFQIYQTRQKNGGSGGG